MGAARASAEFNRRIDPIARHHGPTLEYRVIASNRLVMIERDAFSTSLSRTRSRIASEASISQTSLLESTPHFEFVPKEAAIVFKGLLVVVSRVVEIVDRRTLRRVQPIATRLENVIAFTNEKEKEENEYEYEELE